MQGIARDINAARLSRWLSRWSNCVAFNTESVPGVGKRTISPRAQFEYRHRAQASASTQNKVAVGLQLVQEQSGEVLQSHDLRGTVGTACAVGID